MSLSGKVCVVTGASSGIGEAIAVLFAGRGACVVLCGQSEVRLDNSVKRCQDAAMASSENGDKERFISVLGDLREEDVRRNIIKTTVDAFGRVDVLVCNAGVLTKPVSIVDTTEDMYDEIMAVNVKSVFFLIKEAIPRLEESKGSVVCISSIASHLAASAAAYCMSKASLDHMCHCLATDLGPKGIRVNTVNPTFVKSRFLRSVIPPLAQSPHLGMIEPFLQSKAPLHPFEGRLPSPEDVAKATAFLASDESSVITGQNVDVDGGIGLTNKAFYP